MSTTGAGIKQMLLLYPSLAAQPGCDPPLDCGIQGFYDLRGWTENRSHRNTCIQVLQDRVFLCSSGCPETSFVDQADLELTEILLPPECLKGLKERATMN